MQKKERTGQKSVYEIFHAGIIVLKRVTKYGLLT